MTNDASAKKNLSTYTSYNSFIDNLSVLTALNKNLIDRKAYTGISAKEREVIGFLKESVQAPASSKGIITSGSSEAIILAISFYLMKYRSSSDKTPNQKPNLVISKLFHNIFSKAAAIHNFELRAISTCKDGSVNIEEYEEQVDENTFCIVGIAGTTETGSVDDLTALAKIAKEREIPFHVDAAIGGGVLPYLANAPKFNFAELPEVTSMNISLGKYGTGVPGLGILLLRDNSPAQVNFPYEMEYISGGKTGDMGLLCSRPSYPLVHFHRKIKKMGKSGFRNYIKRCTKKAEQLRELLRTEGFEVISSCLPVVTFTHSEEAKMLHIKQQMKNKGYTLAYANIESLGKKYARIVVRKNFTSRALEVLKVAIDSSKVFSPEETSYRSGQRDALYFFRKLLAGKVYENSPIP